MAGEDPDVRRKHHRSPDDGVEEGSKRWKHSYDSHHHHHRRSKPKHEMKDQDVAAVGKYDNWIPVKKSRYVLPMDGGTENRMMKIDESDAGYKSSMSRKKKGDRRHGDFSSRDSSPIHANEDVAEKSYLVDMKTYRGPKPATKEYEKDRISWDNDESVLCRRGRSKSPVDKGDADSGKHRIIEDSIIKNDGLIDDEFTTISHLSTIRLELMDNQRNGLGNRRTSMSPGSRGNKYKSVSRSLSDSRYKDEPQVGKRSMSHDHVRERSVSQSIFQERRVHHNEWDVRSYSDTSDRGKTSDYEYDNEAVDRHGSKDYHSERKQSSSYGRHSGWEDRHGSRDTLDRDREKEIGRERVREAKTDVVVGSAQPTYSSPIQFGSIKPKLPNPPNPKQTQPHCSIQSSSRPNTNCLGRQINPKQSGPPPSYLTLLVSWGRGLRSTNNEPIRAIPPVFTVHTLAGDNIPEPPGFQVGPFDGGFGGDSRQATEAIYQCRNIRHNYRSLRMYDREHRHNIKFWRRRWERHASECMMSQADYYEVIFREFRDINVFLYPAFLDACGPVINGRSYFNVNRFLLELGNNGLFPSVHVADTVFSVNQEEATEHQELVELKFYLSLTVPRVSYHFPTKTVYDRTRPVFVTRVHSAANGIIAETRYQWLEFKLID